MKLLDFVNTHENWEELLTTAPYNLTVKHDGKYVLFMYNMIESNMTLPEVLEARGVIFYEGENGYECVCRPFDKFFNHGEVGAAEIDWRSAYVMEKVDGSLMKLWCHKGDWHLSTNGTINAFDAFFGDIMFQRNFGELFIEAFRIGSGIYGVIPEFLNRLDKNFTYMFELVSPETRLVVKYDAPQLYYLGKRCTANGVESGNRLEAHMMRQYGIKRPKVYPLRTLEDCVGAVENFSSQEEGFVVCDKHYNRIKIKSPAYLAAFHIHNNGKLSTRGILEAMKLGVIDDFYAYAIDTDKEKVDCVRKMLFNITERWNADDERVFLIKDRAELAATIKDWESKAYIFYMRDHHCTGAMEYLLQRCTIPAILRILEKEKERENKE